MPEENKPPKPALAALFAFLASGTGRRLIVFLVSFLTVTLNKKLGLDLDANALIADVTMALGYIAQSAAKEASDAHAEAKSHRQRRPTSRS
jgi:hypothetical protein